MTNFISAGIRKWIVWIFSVGLVISLGLVFVAPAETLKLDGWTIPKMMKAAVLVVWLLAPPIWFWVEYFFVDWKSAVEGSGSEQLERFKYGQDISSKIWLAVSTVLLMLYFGKDIRQG
jgi:hypothetical protein